MTELLAAAEMRRIEEVAIASGKVTGLTLMERAGAGVVAAIADRFPNAASASIFCGPGNNGGDGYVVARLLAARGYRVRVWAYGDPERLPQDALAMRRLWQGDVRDLDYAGFRQEAPTDIYVDAVFGTGLSRSAEGALKDVLEHIAGSGGDVAHYQERLVAVDAPSGLCLDSGRILGADVPFAALTVTFGAPKIGHYLCDGPSRCGELVVVDIGLGAALDPDDTPGMRPPKVALLEDVPARKGRRQAPQTWRFEPAARLVKRVEAHKFDYGHAMILSGGVGRGGAARLAARGALRVGAGLVTLGCPPGALQENAARLDAVMTRAVRDADGLDGALADQRINTLCLGPGLGLDRARELVPVALEAGRRIVLDADALTAFEGDPDALVNMLHKDCVLTPHMGEFARLFPDLAKRLQAPPVAGPAYSKVDAVRDAAARAGCTVLLKGPDTVMAFADSVSVHAAVYDRAAPWLATAGSGDVLAGFITGMLARCRDQKAAVETAVWLHTECARAFGPGLIAEDLPERVPEVLRRYC